MTLQWEPARRGISWDILKRAINPPPSHPWIADIPPISRGAPIAGFCLQTVGVRGNVVALEDIGANETGSK